jgi:predicted porin
MRRSNGGSPVPKSDILFIGASYNIAPLWTLDAAVFRLDFKNSANQATLFAVRGTYQLSKRTAAYATLGHVSNDGTLAVSVSGGGPGVAPKPGANQSGAMLGVRHIF